MDKEEILMTLFIPCFFITMIILVAKISSTKAYNKKEKKRISKNEKLEGIKSKIGILDSGYGFYIYDFVDRPIYFHLDYSEEEKNKYISEILDKELKNGDNVVNIGTGNGIIPIVISKKVGQNGKIFCFDRYKENCELLKNDFKLNFLSNFKVYNIVASNKQKDPANVWKIRRYPGYNLLTYIVFDIPLLFISVFRFIIDIIIKVIGAIFKYKYNPSQVYDVVPVNSIDNIIYESNTRVDFIMINQNEPNIYDICYGLEKIIKKYHPKIIFTLVVKFYTDESKKVTLMEANSKKFLDWLKGLNYNMYGIDYENNISKFKKIDHIESESFIYENRYGGDSYIKTIYLK